MDSSAAENIEDLFRKSFKKFKSIKEFQIPYVATNSKSNTSTSEVIEHNTDAKNILIDPTLGEEDAEDVTLNWKNILHQRPLILDSSIVSAIGDHKSLGLHCPSTWKIYDLQYPNGLIFIRNPFTTNGQRYWIKRSVIDFPNDKFVTNIDNLESKEGISIKSKLTETEFYKKLRWVTFGYHHNWDTKIYSEEHKSHFPEDLADLTKYIALVLGFKDFKAEAAISNYYHLDSTLSGHVDRSEANQTAPLFSLSFGQPAVFLIGGRTKSVKPQAILLRSGDIAIMSENSRLSYHGVPKVFYSSDQPWLIPNINCSNFENLPGGTSNAEIRENAEEPKQKKPRLEDDNLNINWCKFLREYVSKSRINLNIRQVLFPGHSELKESIHKSASINL